MADLLSDQIGMGFNKLADLSRCNCGGSSLLIPTGINQAKRKTKMIINIKGIENDIDLKRAISAHSWISFRPEERGAMMVKGYIETLTNLAQIITEEAKDQRQKDISQDLFDRMRSRYLSFYNDWISAKSRCASSAITGGSGFNVARAEKANAAEHNKMVFVLEFEKTMRKYVKKKLAAVYSNAELQENDIERTRRNIAASKKLQENMKAGNKFYKAWKKNPDAPAPAGLSESLIEQIKAYKPTYSFDLSPFAPYQMQNNLANIKRMEGRLAELEAKSKAAEEVGEKQKELNGLKIVQNFTEDRLQLLFDDKPSEQVRSVLKYHGFKWSPNNSAWQRKLTDNAMYSLNKLLLPKEEMKQYTALWFSSRLEMVGGRETRPDYPKPL